jgi:regulator of sigma E protease
MNFISAMGGTGWTLVSVVIPFLFVLTIVVFFHELGHFWVARRCGVRVEVFSIGFGRELVGFNDRHGTRWKLSAIPLGGYVKFFGDADAASKPDFAGAEAMSADERSVSFLHKSIAQRAAIVAAGPIANFILAIVVFAGIFSLFGKPFIEPRVGGLVPVVVAEQGGFRAGDVVFSIGGERMISLEAIKAILDAKRGERLDVLVSRGSQQVTVSAVPEASWFQGSVAEQAGFRPGDLVVSINGRAIESFTDMQRFVEVRAGEPLQVVVNRDGRTVELTATPSITQFKDRFGGTHRVGRLGISPSRDQAAVVIRRYDPLMATWLGVKETWFVVERTFGYLGGVIMGTQSADQLGGPIRIAQVSGEAASIGFGALLSLVALISVSIGLLNLFPIPMLDGGHLVFYAIEAIRGRPMSEQAQEMAFRVGLGLVLMLMIFATWNDLRGLVG